MRVLLAHNSYLQPGGEDLAFEADVDLLQRNGHAVDVYAMRNDTISTLNRASLISKTLWNRQAHSEILDLINRNRPDVAHFHNTFPLMSPSAIAAARSV